jgi:hypothetical protein
MPPFKGCILTGDRADGLAGGHDCVICSDTSAVATLSSASFARWPAASVAPTSYPAAAGLPSNTDDDVAIISATLTLQPDEQGSNPATARVLCVDTTCSPSLSTPGFVTTTIKGRISSADDRDYYNVTANTATDRRQKLKVVITYQPNWSKRSVALDGSDFSQSWRISNLRLQLRFEQQEVEVLPGPVNEWSTQQEFAVTLPAAGGSDSKLFVFDVSNVAHFRVSQAHGVVQHNVLCCSC